MNESHDRSLDGDLLISRIVDGEATEADWTAFRAVAEHQPSLWRDLAECQRDQSDMASAVAMAISIADGVEAPVHEEMGRQLLNRTRLVSTWGGWAAAAAVILAWSTGAWSTRQNESPVIKGGLVDLPSLAPRDVINRYMDEGKISPSDLYNTYLARGQESGAVVGEVPDRVLVTARPMKAGGGYEVIYLRQIMERTHVKELNKVGFDEIGRPIPLPYEMAPTTQPGRF